MSNRTRARGAKIPPGATAIRVPRQRRRGFGGRQMGPIILVVPEKPSLAARATYAVGGWVWDRRRSWAPTGIAVVAFVAAAIVHVLAWWTGLVLAPATAAPLVWLWWTSRHRPAEARSVRRWRRGLALLGIAAAAWAALAVAFGPTAGPLELLWLIATIAAQALWLQLRRTSPDPIEEIR
ncbi:hypothetical protein [Streptomyces tirandamycinicus]|uniref:Uncharacterized protein n=1 Tax=Streptomyces tirandamycinicus TaxID=2174846 RepID=A0A2S1SVK8_9ACTN|nr:hypothetical protein [Streptomyces tirandamycinicus]AWI30416.1 hypothetical protein DDW44_17755 [Streptomyces tirandamycinicus]